MIALKSPVADVLARIDELNEIFDLLADQVQLLQDNLGQLDARMDEFDREKAAHNQTGQK